jgi:ABC-type lipoprotein export system ATPase subunit
VLLICGLNKKEGVWFCCKQENYIFQRYLRKSMIETSNLTFGYSNKTILRFDDFSLSRGEQCLILGKSGMGKTTLLHLLGGLLEPLTGNIYIGDTNISTLKKRALDRFRGQNIGIVFQNHHFVAALNVGENIELAQVLADKKPSRKEILQILDALQMADKVNRMPYSLSQGEQQRVAIARALINKPAIVLADEPTSALDDDNCATVMDLLQKNAALSDSGLIIVTHDNRLTSRIPKQILLQAT